MKKRFVFISVVIVVFVGISCKKKTTTPAVITNAAIPVDINSNPQISYTLLSNSQAVSYIAGGGVLYGSSSSGSLNTNTKYYSSRIYTSHQTILNINKGIMPSTSASGTNSSLSDSTSFKGFFPVGNLSYSAQGANPISGIEITMIDSLGTTWSTSNGPQSGCTFHIDETQQSWDHNGIQNMKIKASFTCILYNVGSTKPSKGISNGVYIGYFENQ